MVQVCLFYIYLGVAVLNVGHLQVDRDGPPIWRCLFSEDNQFDGCRPILYDRRQGDYGQELCYRQ